MSAGFVIGFGQQMVKYDDERRAREEQERQFLREQAMYLNKTLLPEMVERRRTESALFEQTKNTAGYLKERGVTDEQLATVFDTEGAEGLVRVKTFLEKADIESGRPLKPEEVGGIIRVTQSSAPSDVPFTTYLDTIKPQQYDLDMDNFRLDEEDPALAEYVYSPSRFGGGGAGGFTFDVSGVPQKPKPVDVRTQTAEMEVFKTIAPTAVNTLKTDLEREATKARDDGVPLPEDYTKRAELATRAEELVKSGDMYGAIKIMQSPELNVLPSQLLSDLAQEMPSLLENPMLPYEDRQSAKAVVQNQMKLIETYTQLEGNPEEQTALIEAYIEVMGGPEYLPLQLRSMYRNN